LILKVSETIINKYKIQQNEKPCSKTPHKTMW